MLAQVVDEPAWSTPFLDSLAERGVELDATAEKESGDCLTLKTAGTKERMRDGGDIVRLKTVTYAVDVTQRRENIQRAWQNTLARKKLQHSFRAGPHCAFPYRRFYGRARIQ